MNLLELWNKRKFSIYENEEKTVLKLLEFLGKKVEEICKEIDNKVEEGNNILEERKKEIENEFNKVNALFKEVEKALNEKTNLKGDHLGSWQGVAKPSQVQEGIQGQVDLNTDNIKKISSYVSVESYNNLVENDDWTNAIKKCLEENNTCMLENKTYKITDTIVLKSSQKIIGQGQLNSILKINATGKSVFDVGGKFVEIGNMTISRDNWDKTNKSDVGINVKSSGYLGQSIFHDLEIENQTIGFYCDNTTNFYSCVLRDFWVHNFSDFAIKLIGFGGTGCILDNIYLTNWLNFTTKEKEVANGGLMIKNYNEFTVNQLNIEHGIYSYGVYVGDCNTVKLNAIHVEGYEQRSDYKAVVFVDGGTCKIGELGVVYSAPNFDRETLLSKIKTWNLLGVNRGATLKVETLINTNNYEVVGQSKHFIVKTDNVSNCYCYNADSEQKSRENTTVEILTHIDKDNIFKSFSNLSYKDNYRKHQLKNYNGTEYYIEKKNGLVINRFLNFSKKVGKWKKGDIIEDVFINNCKDILFTQSGYYNAPVSTVVCDTTTEQLAVVLKNGTGDFKVGDNVKIGNSTKTYEIVSIYSVDSVKKMNLDKNLDITMENALIQYAEPVFVGINKLN